MDTNDLNLIAAKSVLGRITIGEMTDFADQEFTRGNQSEEVCLLSLPKEVSQELFHHVLRQLGVEIPERVPAGLFLINSIAEKISCNQINPSLGFGELFDVYREIVPFEEWNSDIDAMGIKWIAELFYLRSHYNEPWALADHERRTKLVEQWDQRVVSTCRDFCRQQSLNQRTPL